MRTIIVTGESRGLGATIAETLLSAEYAVIGISRSETEAVNKIQSKYPGAYTHIKFDLAEISEIPELFEKEIAPEGPIAGLVNNAAVAYDELVVNADLNQVEEMFRLNVQAPIALTKATIRDCLLQQTASSIVHVSSVSAQTGATGLAMYGATNGALEAFSRGVAREYGDRGIRSNCVAPGYMKTDMTANIEGDERERIESRAALDQFTSLKSVAEMVQFLLSEKAESITGKVIGVDSGLP